jgi:hypothetical protein
MRELNVVVWGAGSQLAVGSASAVFYTPHPGSPLRRNSLGKFSVNEDKPVLNLWCNLSFEPLLDSSSQNYRKMSNVSLFLPI